MQHRLSGRIGPVLPETSGQARVDLPGRDGLSTRCKRRVDTLPVALEVGKGAIALSIGRARQEHMGLLAPREAIRRLHNQAVELRGKTRYCLGTKRRDEIDPDSVQDFDTTLFN